MYLDQDMGTAWLKGNFPLSDNVTGFRSRWVWTRTELLQQMTDGSSGTESLSHWSDWPIL